MYCQKCGKEIDNKVTFCPFCGTSTKTEQVSEKATDTKMKIGGLAIIGIIFSVLDILLGVVTIGGCHAFFPFVLIIAGVLLLVSVKKQYMALWIIALVCGVVYLIGMATSRGVFGGLLGLIFTVVAIVCCLMVKKKNA